MLGVTNEDNLDWNLIRKGDWWGGSYALKKKKKPGSKQRAGNTTRRLAGMVYIGCCKYT